MRQPRVLLGAVAATLVSLTIAQHQLAHGQVPQGPGGRGPNPMVGLAGFVESPTTGPDAPRFEVASVKRNKVGGGNPGGSRTLAGGAYRATNATLRMLIRAAYRLSLTDELVGGPPWIDSYGFDVDARPATSVTLAESSLMLRTLLADRFKLVARKETREQPIYALVLARRDGTLGPQIKRSSGDCVMVVPGFARAGRGDAAPTDSAKPQPQPAPGQPGRRCGVGPDGDVIKAGSATMTTLVTFLIPGVDRPIIDRTGLSGSFDFDLRFDATAFFVVGRGRGAAVSVAVDTPPDPAKGPSIFTALQEQLGLRLESGRGPVTVLAIHAAELPGEN